MIDNRSAAYAALVLRVSLGVLALIHGLVKVFVFTIPGTVGFFGSIGLPPIIAYLTIFAEVFGGLALVLGVHTRLAALGLIPILLGATWAHLGNGFMFSGPGGGYEYPLFWTIALGVQALLGPGAFALGNPFAKLLPGPLAKL